MRHRKIKQSGLMIGVLLVAANLGAQARDVPLGRWDLDVHRQQGSQASWMEVSDIDGVLHVNFVGPVGDAAEATGVKMHNSELEFLVPKDPAEGKDLDVHYIVRLVPGKLTGSVRATDGTTATFTGVPAPTFVHRKGVTWGKQITLFDGKELTNWHFSNGKHGNWTVQDGVLRNAGHGAELISDGNFRDFKLHLEFKSGSQSNSGLYLRGRYEVQIETNSAQEKSSHHTGGVYGFLEPHPEQPRKADVWQTYDIVLVGRTLTVVQNGITVIDHQDIPGITGGALDSREGTPGPIYLQGSEDGITDFRNLTLTPAVAND